MKKIKVTKRQRKYERNYFAWYQTKGASNIDIHNVAGPQYRGGVPEYHITTWHGMPAEARKIKPGVPFIRIG